MRVKARFVIPMKEDIATAFYERIGLKIPERDRKWGLYVIEPYMDSDRFVQITEALKEFGIECRYTEEKVYTKAEMEATPLFMVLPLHCRAGYPQPENNYFSVSFDASTGCPSCSNGRLQNAPLHLRSNVSIGKADVSGIEWTNELVVSKRARMIMEQAGLSGFEFWELIRHGKKEPFTDIFQLKINAQLPPMADETVLKVTQTIELDGITLHPFCDNGCGQLSLTGSPYYHAEVLKDLPDFCLSSEWIGGGRGRFRIPFASQKTYRLFQENKIKGLNFLPVIIVP